MSRMKITGLILAGGLGRRMGGRDKGLQSFRGKPLAAWAIERLAPQVDTLLVNANQNPDAYTAFGHPVVTDRIGGFAGPLAGVHAGLSICETPLLLSAPCDSPFLPDDLAARLRAALEAADAEIAVARTGQRRHSVFALLRRETLASLTAFLAAGGRKVEAWHATLRTAEAPFADEHAFANINTLEELGQLEP
jgi:molybdopterin-guanine dinucleotide biosynthesis protein A